MNRHAPAARPRAPGDARGEFADTPARRASYLSYHDALTGLPNRALWQDCVDRDIDEVDAGKRVAVLWIDLDAFKHINHQLGHALGDRLLQIIAERLQHCLAANHSLARSSGDAFLVGMPGIADSREAQALAQRILGLLRHDIRLNGEPIPLTASIGIGLYPDDARDAAGLMRAADIAMNHAKEHGRDNVQFFTPQLSESVTRRLELTRRLRRALAQREFVLHYQPQIELGGGGLTSVEALLRWQSADGPVTSCGDFSAVAEETGLMVPIGEWALREACRQLRAWREQGHHGLRMAVNVSPRQLCEAEFKELVCEVLQEYELPGAALEIEITESMLLPQLDTLATLATLGVRFAVDDFGIGYSNLAYLRRLPISTLKIDRSFVGGVGRTTNDTAIVNAIVAMAKSLRLRIVAEGVERAEQLLFLEAVGCHAVQGFFFSAAQPAHAIGPMLGAQAPALTDQPRDIAAFHSPATT